MAAPSRTSTSTDIALISVFAALIAVCALIPPIPTGGPVNITLQTFGVLLAGAVLGARRGFLAALLYLAVGAAGVPIFSGYAGGLSVFAGPSVGYLIAFPLAAGLCGLLVERIPRGNQGLFTTLVFVSGLLSSALLIHTLGAAGMHFRLEMSWSDAFIYDARFYPGDVAKNLAMAFVASAVHRAFPDLLRTPRAPTSEKRETITA